MKKSDCVTIFICIVFLFFILGAISQGGREQARILACSASLKQIGAILTTYQADNDGYVPVMRNKFTLSYINAKSSLLSLAFRNYSPELDYLPPYLNPDMPWNWDQVLEYAQNWLPDFYICPFARGKSQATLLEYAGNVEVCPELVRMNYKSTGRMDSYSTWLWPRPKDFDFWPGEHCYGPNHGKNKYENLVWHNAGSPDGFPDEPFVCLANSPTCDAWMQSNPRRFSNQPRISERTALYCAHGEIDESVANRIFNYGSHKRGNRGGTNVLFGDIHVEWVQGSQISAGN
jgi:hypothetical protein